MKVSFLRCEICHRNPKNPYANKCGHIFCSECIKHRLESEKTCPICHAEVSYSSLRKVFSDKSNKEEDELYPLVEEASKKEEIEMQKLEEERLKKEFDRICRVLINYQSHAYLRIAVPIIHVIKAFIDFFLETDPLYLVTVIITVSIIIYLVFFGY